MKKYTNKILILILLVIIINIYGREKLISHISSAYAEKFILENEDILKNVGIVQDLQHDYFSGGVKKSYTHFKNGDVFNCETVEYHFTVNGSLGSGNIFISMVNSNKLGWVPFQMVLKTETGNPVTILDDPSKLDP